MSDDGYFERLNESVKVFEECDAVLLESVRAGDLAAMAEAVGRTSEAKRIVKNLLAECPSLKVAGLLRDKVRKIRDNYGYTIDRVLDFISSRAGEEISQEVEDVDLLSALYEQGTIDYVDESFYKRRLQVGTLVVSESLPNHVMAHFARIRECYSLGLYHATIVYCRALVETACYEALRRRGRLPKGGDPEVPEFRLYDLLRGMRKEMYSPLWEKAEAIRKHANQLLHSNSSDQEQLTERDCFGYVQDTMAIVEDMFSGTRRQRR